MYVAIQLYENKLQGLGSYLNMVGNFCFIDPVFQIFQSHWVPLYAQLDLIYPYFL